MSDVRAGQLWVNTGDGALELIVEECMDDQNDAVYLVVVRGCNDSRTMWHRYIDKKTIWTDSGHWELVCDNS